MVFHINRSSFSFGASKNHDRISFPEVLDLSRFSIGSNFMNIKSSYWKGGTSRTKQDDEEHDSVPSTKQLYRLQSIVCHYGSHSSGHYVAFKRIRGKWWRISDESATECSLDFVLDHGSLFVYMLFYGKI